MSDMSAQEAAPRVATRERDAGLERSTETKSSFKTSEFFVYVIAVAAVLIASLIVDGFNATEGWMFFTYLTLGSRPLCTHVTHVIPFDCRAYPRRSVTLRTAS
jgi:hypothetical protein